MTQSVQKPKPSIKSMAPVEAADVRQGHPSWTPEKPRLVVGEFQKAMAQLQDRSVQLVLTDPPYNIGHDYGVVSDRLAKEEYRQLVADLAETSHKKAKEDGSLVVIHYPEFFLEHAQEFKDAGWRLHQWISWCYPSNVGQSKRKFTRASRAVVWFAKSATPKFNHKAVVQPYKNPNDKRIKQLVKEGNRGAALYDWWQVNLCKNVSKQKHSYANQIPNELLQRLILSLTDEGDVVADPFSGTGSTAKAASQEGRLGWGCDANPETQAFWGVD